MYQPYNVPFTVLHSNLSAYLFVHISDGVSHFPSRLLLEMTEQLIVKDWHGVQQVEIVLYIEPWPWSRSVEGIFGLKYPESLSYFDELFYCGLSALASFALTLSSLTPKT